MSAAKFVRVNKNSAEKKRMIIDCISDLHGFKPNLNGGDLLIIGGDLTARDNTKSLRTGSKSSPIDAKS